MIAPDSPGFLEPAPQRRRLILIANAQSGSQADGALDALLAGLRAEGATVEAWIAKQPAQLPALAERARTAAPDAIIAYGGDGTVNCLAQALAGSAQALGVVPRGTFNYVAKQYGLPDETAAVVDLLLHAPARPVAAGEVNGRLFLNNCSFGLYTDIIDARERHKAQWGRLRIVAVLSALVTALRSRARLPLRATDASGRVRYSGRASLLFAGVNPQQFRDGGFELADAVEAGALGFVLLRWLTPWRVLAMLAGALLGRTQQQPQVEAFDGDQLRVAVPLRRRLRAVVDGEILHLRPPLRFDYRPAALWLIRPPSADAQTPR